MSDVYQNRERGRQEQELTTSGLGVIQKSMFSEELQGEIRAHDPSQWAVSHADNIFDGRFSVFLEDQEVYKTILQILEVVPHRDIPRGVALGANDNFGPSPIWLFCEAKALLGRPVLEPADRPRIGLAVGPTPENQEPLERMITNRPCVSDTERFFVGTSFDEAVLRNATLIRLVAFQFEWSEWWKLDPIPADEGVGLGFNIANSSRLGTDPSTESADRVGFTRPDADYWAEPADQAGLTRIGADPSAESADRVVHHLIEVKGKSFGHVKLAKKIWVP